jgi:hypothetical protein
MGGLEERPFDIGMPSDEIIEKATSGLLEGRL